MISGKEAAVAWIDGILVEIQYKDDMWKDLSSETYSVGIFRNENYKFRLKPRTINLNGVETGELVMMSKTLCGLTSKVTIGFETSDQARRFYDIAWEVFKTK